MPEEHIIEHLDWVNMNPVFDHIHEAVADALAVPFALQQAPQTPPQQVPVEVVRHAHSEIVQISRMLGHIPLAYWYQAQKFEHYSFEKQQAKFDKNRVYYVIDLSNFAERLANGKIMFTHRQPVVNKRTLRQCCRHDWVPADFHYITNALIRIQEYYARTGHQLLG